MQNHTGLTEEQINVLTSQGCKAENWNNIRVADGFDPHLISNCLFRGKVNIGRNVYIHNIGSYISNYTIGDGAYIENVSLIETSGISTFGNGVASVVVNEGGGREVPLLDNLTAQTSYMMAMYRHRPETTAKMAAIAEKYTRSVASDMGVIGEGARISDSGIIRNVKIGPGAVIEGSTILSNGSINCTPGEPSFIGAGAKLYDFIVSTSGEIDGGSLLRRCFIGEGVKVCGLTGTDSLFFANSHFENGEVCSIFAGPFTVSHHKSSLLIAGMFSFFNAGSGSNQSNHLFKTGPVHQGVHRRGCKFGSDAYVVLPARTGAFTIVLGRHKSHHDTENFPYSYLMEEDGMSWLVPGINLTNCGTVRDLDKWRNRDRRGANRTDIINFEEHNPFITEKINRAIETAETLMAKNAEKYIWHGVRMRHSMLKRGHSWYVLARDKFIGEMLACNPATAHGPEEEYTGPWIDLGGMYVTRNTVDKLLNDIDNDILDTFQAIGGRLTAISERYAANARQWALEQLACELGRTPSPDDIAAAVKKGSEAEAHLKKLTEQDRNKDRDTAMSVGYGIDSDDESEIMSDYRHVRGM